MPGYGWSISALKCKTGSRLATIPGSPCHKCYARRGHYTLPGSISVQQKRLDAWENDPDWVKLMAIRLLYLSDKQQYFRWFDSGDLQSGKMAQDINDVCKLINPYVNCWLPTQERSYVKSIENDLAPNLTVRISSTVVGEKQNTIVANAQTSYVAPVVNFDTAEGHRCPSHSQDNKCGLCRACWDKTTPTIVYRKH
jgi:hypothetical protein